MASFEWPPSGGGGGGGGSLTFSDSLVKTGNDVTLVGDVASPGNSFYYGTDSSGTKGFFPLSQANPFQEQIGVGNGVKTTFTLSQTPVSAYAVDIYKDRAISPINTEWSLSGVTITFVTAPSLGQAIYAVYASTGLFPVGQAFQEQIGVGNGVVTAFNLSQTPVSQYSVDIYKDRGISPVVLEWSLSGSTINFLSAPAMGVAIYAVYASAITGGGGGSTRETHGSASSPVAINPSLGLVPSVSTDQVWWVYPAAGSGAVTIVATPPIDPGGRSSSIGIGDRLCVKTVANANYLKFPNAVGVDQDGDADTGPYAQSLQWTWDGLQWSEDFRRV